MRRILSSSVALVAGLLLVGSVQASHGGGGGHGSMHGGSSHGFSGASFAREHGFAHGTFLSHGHQGFKGRYNHFWSKQCWFPKYGCYCYWCPGSSCWYYWCQPDDCYYPVDYCPYRKYCWESGGVAVGENRLQTAPEAGLKNTNRATRSIVAGADEPLDGGTDQGASGGQTD